MSLVSSAKGTVPCIDPELKSQLNAGWQTKKLRTNVACISTLMILFHAVYCVGSAYAKAFICSETTTHTHTHTM
eukprot:513178-Amphidinium_carterae.1